MSAASDGATASVPNSSTTMEVFFGSTLGKYIGTSNNTANSGGG